MDQELRDQYRDAMRAWSRRGFPQHSAKIRAALDANSALDPDEEEQLVVSQKVIPMVESAPTYAPVAATPPRTGQGSGKRAWQNFAATYSDLDEELIESLSKTDLIAMLEVNDVIPPNE